MNADSAPEIPPAVAVASHATRISGLGRAFLVSVAVVLVATIPYLAAWLSTPSGTVFTGLLSKPLDGHSYLAKMQIGARGELLFHLPYSAEEHGGAIIYPYYILLGRFAAAQRLPLVLVYHAARLAGGVALLLVAYTVFHRLFHASAPRWTAFLLFALGSGWGWLAALWGYLLPDLLLPEATAFHALFSTPHFSLSLALLMVTLVWLVEAVVEDRPAAAWLAGAAAAVMTLLQPFLAITVYAVAVSWLAARSVRFGRGGRATGSL